MTQPQPAQPGALIAIGNSDINGNIVQTVNARDLHVFLEVGKDFSTWMNGRIQQYGFVENQDFTTAPQNGGAVYKGGGHNRKEYHLSLDMAKELAMVERNDKGKQARRYFIECEKALKQQLAQPLVLVEVVQPYVHPLAQQPITEQTCREITGSIAARADLVAKRVGHVVSTQLLARCKAEFNFASFKDLSEADGRRVAEWVSRHPGATVAVNGEPAALPWEKAMGVDRLLKAAEATRPADELD